MSDSSPRSLAVTRLTLTDFRCYGFQRVEVGRGPVVLTGANGAGKTNLLEAVSMLVPGRGLRRAKLSDMARRRPADEVDSRPVAWAVAARADGALGEADLGTGLDVDSDGREKRLVRIDGEPARNQGQLADHLSAVWLTPQMDRLFQDGPSSRRRFLDRLVFGVDPAHAGRINGYDHALRERAKLLKSAAEGARVDNGWLDALEETLAARGVAVAAARLDMAQRITETCLGADGPFPKAALAVEGDVETWLMQGPALAAEERLRGELVTNRRLDGELGGAAAGPHRSDLVVRHLDKNVTADLCSTGEQKALLIAIVLADARLQARERDRVPLMLLDEVAAHLDQRRREALFTEISDLGAQAWMTGTDADLFGPLAKTATYLRVDDAVVTPV